MPALYNTQHRTMSNRESDTLKDVAMRTILSFPATALTAATVERADAVLPHDKQGRLHVKQEVIDALIKDNRFLDETMPLSFYEEDQRRLSFKGASKITESFLEQVCATVPALEYLDLTACFSLKDSAVPLALGHCPSLKTLKLENCRKLTDETFDHIIKLNRQLQALHVGGNFNMTQEGLCRLFSTHPNRANFKEIYCSGIHFTSPLLLALAAHCPKLRGLGVGYNQLMTEEALKNLLWKLKQLRTLHVPWCQRAVTDSLLQFLGDECPQLEELDICGTKGVSAAGIEALLQRTNRPRAEDSSMDADTAGKEGGKEGGRKRLRRLKIRYAGFSRVNVQAVEEAWREEVEFLN